jgi:hypothetical protein
MPRKSTKVASEIPSESPSVVSTSTDEVPVTAAATESNTKKRAPVKRVSKKLGSLSIPATTAASAASAVPPTASTSSEVPENAIQTPVQVNDSINTFNIHIKHISDDGSNIENTFSTTYTHTTGNGSKTGNICMSSDSDSDGDGDSSVSINSDGSDSDNDSDYDTKFTNSTLTNHSSIPTASSASSSCATSLLKSSSEGASAALCEDANPLYTTKQINYDILIPFVLINMHASSRENIMALLHTTLISCIEGRCITEGFIKPHSTRIIDFKCGKIVAKNVQFNIVIECLVCNPQPQSIITCVAKNITQAGIRAVSDDEYSPIVVYITRDFGVESDKSYYNSVKEGDKINTRVIGKRFEMNDKQIQIIGFLVQPKKDRGGVASLLNSKKAPVVQQQQQQQQPPVTETKKESVMKTDVGGGGNSAATKRAPRKTKNPLSIVNDTDNNVITITYDEDIDLPKESKSVKPAKAAKAAKEPKEPKVPKKTKKETSEVIAVTSE